MVVLAALVRKRLASYKVSRSGTFVDEFPLTSNGTVQKFRLPAMVRGQ